MLAVSAIIGVILGTILFGILMRLFTYMYRQRMRLAFLSENG